MSLFKRKKEEAAKATPESLLVAGFTAAWKGVSGAQTGLTLTTLKPEDIPPGTTAMLVYSGSNVPVAAFTSGLFGETGRDIDDKMEKLARSWLAGSGMSPADATEVCSVSLSGSGRDSFSWQVMELKGFAVASAPGKTGAGLWICLRLWDRLKSQAEGRPLPETQNSAEARRGYLRAERPRDLPALEAFCPRSFRFENRSFVTAVRGFAVFRAGSRPTLAMEGPVWFKAAFEYVPKTPGSAAAAFNLYYAFQKQAPSLAGIAGGLFTETARQYLAAAGFQPGRLGLKALEEMPPALDAASFLTVDFFVRSSGFSLQAALFAPAETIPHIAPSPGGNGQTLRRLLELNASLLEKSLPSLLTSPELRPRIPQLCVNELFRLLSDQDFALVIQNVLLPEYGAKEMPALLFYTAKSAGPDGTEKEIILPYGPLDGQRLEAFLPEAFREEFFRNTRTLTARGIESCTALNAEALHSILAAVRSNRIAASPRLAWLLDELVRKGDRSEAGQKMAVLKERGIPFAALKSLHPKTGQRICAALDDRDIALALIDCEGELALLGKIISAAKRQRLGEDVRYFKKMISQGELELSEAIAAKEKIAATVAKESGESGIS